MGLRAALVAAGLCTVAVPAAAQYRHDRWDRDQWEHMAAGAVVAVAVRGPWIAPGFRNALWKRGSVQLVLSVGYEVYQRFAEPWVLPARDTLYDLLADMLGWVGVELVAAVIGRD